MKEIRAEIEIDASARRIWAILTDFASYEEWNPFIRRMGGDLRTGSRLEGSFQPPGSRAIRFKPRLLEVEPERKIRWLGNLLIPGLVDGEHTLAIEEIDADRARFIQDERFTGILVPLLSRTLASTVRGFEAMNRALKERAESLGA